MLGDERSANTKNWVNSLTCFGPANVEVWSFPKYPSWLRLLYVPIAVFKVRRKIDRMKPDIIIGYRTTSYGFIGALTKFRPLVLAAQGESDVWPPGHWSNVLTGWMASYAIREADIIHAWGKNMVPALLSLGANKNNVVVMPRGIDVSKFTYKTPATFENQMTLITTRSLFPEYHHDILIEAFAEVVKKCPKTHWKLIIVGAGPLKQQLMNLCANLKIDDKVFFTGKLELPALSNYLSESDIYISLPDTEGISASLLEAMASGCYPIVTDLPANREIIESEKNGRLVPLNSLAVTSAILELPNRKQEIQEATIMNRSAVELYADSRVNAPKFVSMYKQLIKR